MTQNFSYFYLFQKIENSFEFFSLTFVWPFLSEAQLGSHEGIVNDVKYVTVVILEEEEGLLSVGIVQEDSQVLGPCWGVPFRVQNFGRRFFNIFRLFRRLPFAEHGRSGLNITKYHHSICQIQ